MSLELSQRFPFWRVKLDLERESSSEAYRRCLPIFDVASISSGVFHDVCIGQAEILWNLSWDLQTHCMVCQSASEDQSEGKSVDDTCSCWFSNRYFEIHDLEWNLLMSLSDIAVSQSFKEQLLSFAEVIVLRLYSAGSQLSWSPEAHQTCFFFFFVTSAVKSLNGWEHDLSTTQSYRQSLLNLLIQVRKKVKLKL